MVLNDIKPSTFDAPLPELLEKLYPVGLLNSMCQEYLPPTPGAPTVLGKMKKSGMIALIVALEQHPERLMAFCERMPPLLQKALQILAWVDHYPVVALEKEIGVEILHIQSGPARPAGDYRPREHKIEQEEVFQLIVIGGMSNYWGHQEIDKSQATASIPLALRKFFKRGLPAPAHSEIIALEKWSGKSKTSRFHDGGEFLASDLRALGDGFRRGNIKRNKDGSLSKSCLREFQKLVRGGEFFPPGDGVPDDLERVRLSLLLEFFNRKGNPLLPPENLTSASLAEFLRSVGRELADSQVFVLEEVLPHLRPDSPGTDPQFLRRPFCRLLALFSELPEGRWVSAQNLLDYRMYREIDLKFFAVRYYSARRVKETTTSVRSYAYYVDRTRLSHDNGTVLLLEPMIRGMAFFLASLGFLEICYGLPHGHSKWRLDDQQYLTPFDGLEAVRLTPAGAFAFGLRKDLPLTVRDEPKCKIHLYPEHLLARATHPDPITEKLLREFMEELEPGFYRLDRKRFLAGCSDPKKILDRVEDFKRRLPAELPPFWEKYFEDLTLESCPALRTESIYTVYALGDSPELVRLFSTDPELRENCLRVEGHRVAIPADRFLMVRKRLVKAGFFV